MTTTPTPNPEPALAPRDAASTSRPAPARRDWVLPALLALATVLVYAPSLSAGFLNYDDPWLIRDNPVLRDAPLEAWSRIFCDLGRENRLTLGAEYLPLRDLSHWVEIHVFGVWPQGMRGVQLALYVAAMLFFRGALRRAHGPGVLAEVAAWVFALHPVHVESVAWLAGRKDVLALLFIGAALYTYAGNAKHRVASVPLLLVAACLSKSMSVAAPALFAALDLAARRRPAWVVWGTSALAIALVLPVHVLVGQAVNMTTPPVGGSRWAAIATMGPVVLRYLELAVFPPALSLVHDVHALVSLTPLSIVGWLTLFMLAVASLYAWRRHQEPLPLVAWLWFFGPLVPVSQIIFPLQNLMTDRYLWLSVMAPALGLGVLAQRWVRGGLWVSASAAATFALFTTLRALLFAEPAQLYTDALSKTTLSPVPPYQLGKVFEDRGDDEVAIRYYELTLERAPGSHEVARRATNGLAKLRARAGRLDEAEAVLVRGLALWPDDPKIVGNLAEVLARQGRHQEAIDRCRQLIRRWPDYSLGVTRCHQRYGL
jgi:tetratricopeptide (TPR) repeat protein